MNDVTIDDVALREFLAETDLRAVSILGDRIATDAKPLTHVLRTKPPGRKEWYYSLPAGRLRASIRADTSVDEGGPVCNVVAGVPLGRFQGLWNYASGAYGASRSHTASIFLATEMQRGTVVS